MVHKTSYILKEYTDRNNLYIKNILILYKIYYRLCVVSTKLCHSSHSKTFAWSVKRNVHNM